MKEVKFQDQPYSKLLPDKISRPSSIVISGPGGSGKPLVGLKLVSEWLQNGGGVIFILTSMGEKFISNSLSNLYQTDLDDFSPQTNSIKLDPGLKAEETKTKNEIKKANLLIPEVWKRELKSAKNKIDLPEKDLLIFGSALNLLLFSPSYGEEIKKVFKDMIENPGPESVLFAVSDSAFSEYISRLESLAQILLYATMDDWQISLKRKDLKDRKSQKVKIPLKKEKLQAIRNRAQNMKAKLLPSIKKN